MYKPLCIGILLLKGSYAFADCSDHNLLAGMSAAELAASEAAVADVPFSTGNLWQVDGFGHTSYVFGTMHLYDSRHAPNVAALTPLIQNSAQMLVEFTEPDQLAFQDALFSNPELYLLSRGSLIDRLGEAAWAQLTPELDKRGLPHFVAAKMQPWFLGLTLAIPECVIEETAAGFEGVDAMIEQVAQDAGLPIASLDSAENMMALLSGDPEDQQVEDLKWALDNNLLELTTGTPVLEMYFRENSWAGWTGTLNLPQVQALARADRELYADIVEDFTQELLFDRNAIWHDLISGAMKSAPSFVAVGALHLPTEEGVLARLAEEGFTLTRLPLPQAE